MTLIVVLLVSLVTSKGAHGIPPAIVILAATLSAIPAIPVLGLVLILPVDWFVGIARALTNLIGPRRDGGRRGVGERHRSCPRDPRAESRAALRAGRRGRPRGAGRR